MNDAPPGTPGETAPPAADTHQLVAPFRFLGQFIKDLSFETPHAPEIFSDLRGQSPEMEMLLDNTVRQLDGAIFEVTLSVNLTAKIGEKTAFILELVYNSVVELNPQLVPQEHAHPLLLIEVPRHMFPFVRQIVAEITTSAGFPSLLLQIVDFTDMYRRKFASGVPGSEAGAEEPAGAEPPPAPPSVH